jgi:hypothetical protein
MALMSFGMAEGLAYKYKADKDVAYFSAQEKAKSLAKDKLLKETQSELKDFKIKPLNFEYNVNRMNSEYEKSGKEIGAILMDPTLDPISKQIQVNLKKNNTENHPIYAEDKKVKEAYGNLLKDIDARDITEEVGSALKAQFDHYAKFGGEAPDYTPRPKDTSLKDAQEVGHGLRTRESGTFWGTHGVYDTTSSTKSVPDKSIEDATYAFLAGAAGEQRTKNYNELREKAKQEGNKAFLESFPTDHEYWKAIIKEATPVDKQYAVHSDPNKRGSGKYQGMDGTPYNHDILSGNGLGADIQNPKLKSFILRDKNDFMMVDVNNTNKYMNEVEINTGILDQDGSPQIMKMPIKGNKIKVVGATSGEFIKDAFGTGGGIVNGKVKIDALNTDKNQKYLINVQDPNTGAWSRETLTYDQITKGNYKNRISKAKDQAGRGSEEMDAVFHVNYLNRAGIDEYHGVSSGSKKDLYPQSLSALEQIELNIYDINRRARERRLINTKPISANSLKPNATTTTRSSAAGNRATPSASNSNSKTEPYQAGKSYKKGSRVTISGKTVTLKDNGKWSDGNQDYDIK